MPKKRIKGPARKNVVKPMRQIEVDFWRGYEADYINPTLELQVKKKKKSKKKTA